MNKKEKDYVIKNEIILLKLLKENLVLAANKYGVDSVRKLVADTLK
jgi:hypothetical protein